MSDLLKGIRNYDFIYGRAIGMSYKCLESLGEDMAVLTDRDKHLIDCMVLATYRIIEHELRMIE